MQLDVAKYTIVVIFLYIFVLSFMSQRWAHFLYSQLNESMICRRSITTKINPDVCTLPFFLMIILHSKLLGQSKAFVGHDSSHNYNEQSSLGIERVKRREKKSQTMFKAIIGLKGFGGFFPHTPWITAFMFTSQNCLNQTEVCKAEKRDSLNC